MCVKLEVCRLLLSVKAVKDTRIAAIRAIPKNLVFDVFISFPYFFA